MDPQVLAQDLQRSRERLRAVLVRDRNADDAGFFPRSATMRFLLDDKRRRTATLVLGGLASVLAGRRMKKKRRKSRSRRREEHHGVSGALLTLLGSVFRR